MKHLIIGGARSGKSRFAQECALTSGKALHYLATGQARDEEMKARIDRHRAERDTQWTLIEEPLHLGESLRGIASPDNCVLIDCLTLWLSNCLEQQCWAQEKASLLKALLDIETDVILVGNEVGYGIVPMGELSRVFVDENGWLHQDLAHLCNTVTTVIAGLPLALKSPV